MSLYILLVENGPGYDEKGRCYFVNLLSIAKITRQQFLSQPDTRLKSESIESVNFREKLNP